MATPFRTFSRDGHRWPGGLSRSAGLFSAAPEAVAARCGLAFEAGVDDLDYYRACGVELPSGRRVLLLWHERAPVQAMSLEVDWADDPDAARAEAVGMLGPGLGALLWAPDPGASGVNGRADR